MLIIKFLFLILFLKFNQHILFVIKTNRIFSILFKNKNNEKWKKE